MENKTLQNADRIIAVSGAAKEYVLPFRAPNPRRSRLFHNGVDLEKFKPMSKKREEMRRKLGIPSGCGRGFDCAATFYKNGVDTLIEGANIAIKKNPADCVFGGWERS